MTLGELAKRLRRMSANPQSLENEAADRLEAIEKAWVHYVALPYIDQGPMRYGCWPALDAVGDAIEGTNQ